jgi:hypothetical protein
VLFYEEMCLADRFYFRHIAFPAAHDREDPEFFSQVRGIGHLLTVPFDLMA